VTIDSLRGQWREIQARYDEQYQRYGEYSIQHQEDFRRLLDIETYPRVGSAVDDMLTRGYRLIAIANYVLLAERFLGESASESDQLLEAKAA
jgi:hypothetical protein